MKKRLRRVIAIILTITIASGIIAFEPNSVCSATGRSDEKKSVKILIIGNSKTFYNNTPYMLEQMINTDENCAYTTSEIASITWGDHNFSKWINCNYGDIYTAYYKSFDAALRSDKKGKLFWVDKKKQKKRFIKGTAQYKNAEKIWENMHQTLAGKKYDYLILQDDSDEIASGGTSDSSYCKAAKNICNKLKREGTISGNTKIILVCTQAKMKKTEKNVKKTLTVNEIWNDTAIADRNTGLVRKQLLKEGYKNVKVAHTGRAIINYLMAYDLNSKYFKNKFYYKHADTGIGVSKKLFYKDGTKIKAPLNDLTIYDKNHPTLLGSMITTATIYYTMFGSLDKQTIPTYQGRVMKKRINLSLYCNKNKEKQEKNALGYAVLDKRVANKKLLNDIYAVAYNTYKENYGKSLDYYASYENNVCKIKLKKSSYKAGNYFPVYKLKYDVNCDSYNGIVPERKIIKSERTYENALPSLPNQNEKIFLGWYTEKNGGAKLTNTQVLDFVGTKTIYAHWKDIK